MQKFVKALFSLLKETFKGWHEANGTMLAAGLSYYTIFSLAPLLVVAVSVAGLFYDRETVKDLVVNEVSQVAGEQLGTYTLNTLEIVSESPFNGWATGFSLVILVIGASMMFVKLKQAINILWGVAPHPDKSWSVTLRTHFLSILLVLLTGVLVLLLMYLSTILVFFNHYLETVPQLAPIIDNLPEADFGFIFLLFILLFGVTFKTLPEAKIGWRDVWLGAGVTAFVFTVGEFTIGYYLAKINPGGAFGAASSVILILIWVYYSMQIILIGAKFTQVYANRFGSQVVPSQKAVRVIRNLEKHEHPN